MVRLINLIAIALFIIMAAVLLKYKLVCQINIDGESLGYIADREKFEQSVNDIINKEEDNKLYTTIKNMPEYTLTLVAKNEETSEEKILAKIEENAETTYKFFAITVDGKQKVTIANLEEGEKLVKDLKKEYKKAKIGIVEVISTEKKNDVKTIKKAKTTLTSQLKKKYEVVTPTVTTSSIKVASTSKSTGVSTRSSSSTKPVSLNGVTLSVTPVSGVITSRFNSVESIRDHVHKGLDIGAPKGRAIKAAAGGTVIFAGTYGGYGKLVKISHGNGIVTFYGHCSSILVKKGQKVEAGDKIALVGSTGNSTGPHLHFEIQKNGVSLNPQNYLYK